MAPAVLDVGGEPVVQERERVLREWLAKLPGLAGGHELGTQFGMVRLGDPEQVGDDQDARTAGRTRR